VAEALTFKLTSLGDMVNEHSYDLAGLIFSNVIFRKELTSILDC
jgi:hypothetical protein